MKPRSQQSPNQALQRTAPHVTAPASAAAFPPTVQVPRRTLRSLSFWSLDTRRLPHHSPSNPVKNTFLFLALLAALLCPHAPGAPPSAFPEPGPFSIVPTSASEPLMVDGAHVFFAMTAEWRGSTLYIQSWPVELERSYSLSMEAFHPRIHFLYIRPTTKDEIRPPQRGDGRFNFNVGYKF